MPTTTQTASATKPDKASTKYLVVDGRYAAILHEDFPTIPAAMILDALSGEPCKQTISLCAWATEHAEDPAGALLAWSRKHHKGQHRRCGRGRCLPTERPDRRCGGLRDNRPTLGRATTPPSGAEVDSLCGVQVDGDALDAIAARLGV